MSSNDFFERIEKQFQNKLPFVVYRKPNKTEVLVRLQNSDTLYFAKDFTEKGFVFSPFDDREQTVLLPNQSSEKIKISELTYNESLFSNTERVLQDDIQKSNHINLVKKGIEAILNSDLEKVVLSRQEIIESTELNPISIFKKLLYKYPSAFVYCWYHPKVGLWLGATPETLIKIEGHQLSIMALAGTQDYKGSLDVSWKTKEKREQEIVTQFIVDSLETQVDRVKVSDVETVKAGNLVHLKTIINAHLKVDVPLIDVIKSLHPTPAVCGYPKQLAKDFILNNEGYNREFYTGFLGELNVDIELEPRSGKRNIEHRAYGFKKQSTQFYVNLRCMKVIENQAVIYVGGGITESSIAESEWQETVSKSLVIKSIL